jgi:hypothetical protein
MEKKKMRTLKVGLMAGWISLVASPALAKTVSMKDAGVALWMFVLVGAFIVLMQLIPAAILFFSFVGTATTLAFKKEKKAEAAALLPGVEPSPVKK